jgi:hypothetical protein
MTFKRSAIVISLVVALILICAFLAKVETEYLWYIGLSLIGAGVLFLAFNDLILKYDIDKVREPSDARLLNFKYCIGFTGIVVAVGIWIWALESMEMVDFFIKLGSAVFLGGLGGFWFHTYYRKSLLKTEEMVFEIWERFKKRILKAKTPDKARKILTENLRYYLVDGTINSSLDLDLPIVKVDGNPVALSELGEDKEAEKAKMSAYIEKIIDGMGFKVPELDEITEEIEEMEV